MKILSEKDIQKLAANAIGVVDEAGVKVRPFKYQRPEKSEGNKKTKVAWLKSYLGGIMAGIQAGTHEKKVLNGLVTQIVKTMNERPIEIDEKGKPVAVETWKEIDFDIARDERGFIKKIKAKRIN